MRNIEKAGHHPDLIHKKSEGVPEARAVIDIRYKAVAILGWTEFAKYRILQEEQKTNTAPFCAIFYLFAT